MDFDSSTKFISSLGKFLQSLCNGYVEFDKGVEVIGHIYLSVDTGKKIDYILNEKVCKTDENSVTFISNSFHAQPAEKPKPAPKQPKPSEQDKPSDPGGSHEDEILILDEPDVNNSESDSNNTSTSHKRPHPSASKRSYDQSFQRKSRSHPAKHSRPSVQNPNGAHETNSPHSDSNYLASQSLPSDSSIAATSEADISHHSQVFPQTSSSASASSNPVSNIQNIKEEPSSGAHDYDVNVKQEYNDNVDQGEGEQGAYDNQDESAYYGDEYYEGSQGDPNQYSQIQGQQGEYYHGAPGPSGEQGSGDNSDSWRLKFQCDICQKRLRSAWEIRDHKNSVHFKVLAFPCPLCGKGFGYKRSLKRHMETSCVKNLYQPKRSSSEN